MTARFGWDIFCSVVDNYGDIGVCWRLARQLAGEHGMRVRLWVDDLASFARINPGIDPALPAQSSRGVEVRHWLDPFPPSDLADGVADVVIEAFACHLPESWVVAMAAREPKPVWINLEYLSAENWVRGCHGLASPHPRLPLTKHFFFPGYFAGTGGLIAESDLEARRDAFRRDAGAQAQLWSALGVPTPAAEEIRVSLFGYENRAMPELLAAWAESPAPVVCLVPEGRTALQVSTCFVQESSAVGTRLSRGSLEVRIVPFVEQDVFDRLLWACDCNFVRGEDSFVRSQWAARWSQNGAHASPAPLPRFQPSHIARRAAAASGARPAQYRSRKAPSLCQWASSCCG